jgi:hypothetical protein
MRTTVDLPPTVHRGAQELANARGQSLSATLAELIARGLSQLDEPVVVRTDAADLSGVHGHRQVTDAYVVALVGLGLRGQ